MSKYKIKKEKVRQEAVEWQLNFNDHDYSWGELLCFQNYFRNLARKFGLITEFKANGII